MLPKVLALHPELTPEALPTGLIPSTWDSKIFWMEENFSFVEAFQSANPLGFSPFILLEARTAFVVSLLDPERATYFSGMSELSSLLYFLRTSSPFYSTTSFDANLSEYTDKTSEGVKTTNYPQMVLWESDLSQHLEFLTPHARLLIASTTSMPEIPIGFDLHQKWNYGEDSEIGSLYLVELTR